MSSTDAFAQRVDDVWNGRRTLAETFWLWCCLGNAVVLGAAFVALYVESVGGIWLGLPNRFQCLLAFSLALAYFGFACIGTWRSAANQAALPARTARAVSLFAVGAATVGTAVFASNVWSFTVIGAQFTPTGTPLVAMSSNEQSVALFEEGRTEPLVVLRGDRDWVSQAVLSPDGERVLTASEDATARIWDVASGAPLVVLRGDGGAVYTASFSPDGRRVVTASQDGTVHVWDSASGERLFVLQPATALDRREEVTAAVFSPDGRFIAAASFDGTIWIWNAATRQKAGTLAENSRVNSIAFSPDGRRLVSTSDKTVGLWTLADLGHPVEAKLLGHSGVVWSASFSPDGKRIVSASLDGTARVWDGFSGAQIRVLRGHTASAFSATYSPDGRRIITASADGTARVWDAQTGVPQGILARQTGMTTLLETKTLIAERPAPQSAKTGPGSSKPVPSAPIQVAGNLESFALQKAEELGDRAGEASALNEIGISQQNAGDDRNALKNYQTALEIDRAMDNRAGEAIVLNNIGTLQFGSGEYQSALRSLGDALAAYQNTGNKAGAARVSGDIGAVYDAENNWATAIHWYDLAAAQADPTAEYKIGTLYELGHGVAQSYSTAGRWYERAAENGSSDAAAALARMNASGEGGHVNRATAYGWILVASALGKGGALPSAAGTVAPLSATDQAAGRAFAQQFLSSYAQRSGTHVSLPVATNIPLPAGTAEPASPATTACTTPNSPARAVRTIQPTTPTNARQLNISGEVFVTVTLDAQSRVVSAAIAKSPNALLDDAALAAARASTFQTAVVNCKPVGGSFSFLVDFSDQ